MPGWTKKEFTETSTKKCSRCNEVKLTLRDFYKEKSGKPKSTCKKCGDLARIEWCAKNPEANRAMWQRAGHKSRLKLRYGITPEIYAELFKTYGDRCAICDRPETNKRNSKLSLDHEHLTKRIRGFLCTRCNLILGHIGDDPDLLEKAAAYIRKPPINRGMT